MNILVLHGPNLNLLGERPGDERGRTIDELNSLIQTKAAAYGVEVRLFQSNHEGELVDKLHAERRWADAIVVSPGALAPGSYVLKEALEILDKPAVEVFLKRGVLWQRRSLLKAACQATVSGRGFDAYVTALKKLVEVEAKPPPRAKAKKRASLSGGKTLGPRPSEPSPVRKLQGGSQLLTRSLVRQKIAERLSGKLSPSGLATWARAKWLEVQAGASAESGQRELLEESLQSLTLSTVPAGRLGDEQLLELMAQLEG